MSAVKFEKASTHLATLNESLIPKC